MTAFSGVDQERLYQTLANEILLFNLKPGEVISENSLCQRFGISRTPVRSLLQRLQRDGLVSIEPKKSSRVTLLDMDLIVQLIYERLAVETMVLRDYIAARTPADVEKVRYLYSRMVEAAEDFRAERSPSDQFMKADLAMHGEWFHKLNLDFIWSRLSSPQSSYTRFCMLDIQAGNNFPDVLEEHREMLKLIEEGNSEGIEALLKRHLYGGIRRIGPRIYTDFAPYFKPFGAERLR